MLAQLYTYCLVGIEALPVEVEVDVSASAQPKTELVGRPEAAVRESTARITRAIVNSGYQRPNDRVVINLAPAELPKQAASFDLPMTTGILAASGQFISERFMGIKLEQYHGSLSRITRKTSLGLRAQLPMRVIACGTRGTAIS